MGSELINCWIQHLCSLHHAFHETLSLGTLSRSFLRLMERPKILHILRCQRLHCRFRTASLNFPALLGPIVSTLYTMFFCSLNSHIQIGMSPVHHQQVRRKMCNIYVTSLPDLGILLFPDYLKSRLILSGHIIHKGDCHTIMKLSSAWFHFLRVLQQVQRIR